MTVKHLPMTPRYDAPLWGLLDGLPPGEEAEVQVSARDDIGQTWSSTNTLGADNRGAIDLAAARYVDGAGLDAYRYYWSMRPHQSSAPPGVPAAIATSPDIAFADVAPRPFDIDISWDGHTIRETVERCPVAAAIVEQWRDDIVANAFTSTRRNRRAGTVVVVGGSAGGFAWSNQVAALLATSGLDALAIAYHDWSGTHGLPDRIEEQPLELFTEAARRFASRPEAIDGPVMAVGFSKGSEALLALAQRDPTFDLLAAVAPSSHVWESVRPTPDGPVRSCWSWNGDPLPFTPLPIDPAFYVDYDQGWLLDAHTRALASPEPTSRIDLGSTATEVLLVASTGDETWPSGRMADQLATAEAVSSTELVGAGHLVLPPGYPAARTGGSPEANAAADRRMWTQLRRFLRLT